MFPRQKSMIILWAGILFQAVLVAPLAAADGTDDGGDVQLGFKPMYVYQEPDSEESLEGIETQFKSIKKMILTDEEEANLYGSSGEDC